jgi:hypothetical protein
MKLSWSILSNSLFGLSVVVLLMAITYEVFVSHMTFENLMLNMIVGIFIFICSEVVKSLSKESSKLLEK